MKKQKILGIDIGTNSIGWALIEQSEDKSEGRIIDMGSRIVPMDSDLIKNFEEGNSATKAADRRRARGIRRNRFRYKLRRDRLIGTLKQIGWLPQDFQPGHKIPPSEVSVAEMKSLFGSSEVPADWINYYLRKKGLTEKLSPYEIARVLLQFNNRRGFKSNRKSDKIELPLEFQEEKWPKIENSIEEVVVDRVTPVLEDGKQRFVRNKPLYLISLKDGRSGEVTRAQRPEWEGKRMELSISKKTTKSGEQSTTFSEPNKSDWQKRKEAFSKELSASSYHPGEFFFHALVADPSFKVRGRIVDRERLEDEARAILKNQENYYDQLKESSLRENVASMLYRQNDQKKREITNQELSETLLKDIIFFQRPLKSVKSTISRCRYEKVTVVDSDTQLPKEVAVNAAPISSPIYQEFRIWQTVHNMKFLEKEKTTKDELGNEVVVINSDVTDELFPTWDMVADYKERLFLLFDSKEKVREKDVLKTLGLDGAIYRWNYPTGEDEAFTLKGNETKAEFTRVFNRHKYEGAEILNHPDHLERLWHLTYSIDDPRVLFRSLLKQFQKEGMPERVARHLALTDPFKHSYGALSSRAVKKLLGVMRIGKFWDFNGIHQSVKKRIEDVVSGEDNPNLPIDLRNRLKEKGLEEESRFQGLPWDLASYVVYGRHSESSDDTKLVTSEEIESTLIVDQRELRNPIVTQMVNETLRLVQAVWDKFGRPDQIHLELARELQKSSDERKSIQETNARNQRERERAKGLLREMRIGNYNSGRDIDKLLLWEELAPADKKEELKKMAFKRPGEPTKAEVEKYRLWHQQGFRSPYTNEVIPLSELFSPKYEIEHIIPRSRFFDDSFANKVVERSEVNKDKDNLTAYEYILQGSTKHRLLSPDEYREFVNKTFKGKKRELLLNKEVPKKFVERQLVDTRHIGRRLVTLLSRVASHTTDPVVVTNGVVTNELKDSWGLHELMKDVVRWRFKRLEEITGETWDYGKNQNGHLKLKGYSKRIDHRHHALDALTVACTFRAHIQYLSTLSKTYGNKELRNAFRHLLRIEKHGGASSRIFREPWEGFWQETRKAMENIVVSHKNRNRILSKGVNWYQTYIEQEGKRVKGYKKQTKGDLWSARQPLGAGTNYGLVQIKEKKQVKLKEALMNVDRVSGNKIRGQLKRILQQNKGDIKKAISWIAENPIIDPSGNPLNNFLLDVKQRYDWPVTEVCWFIPSIVDDELRQEISERWEACHRNEHLFRFSLDLKPISRVGEPISKVEIETYPLKSVSRVDLLHSQQNSWTEKKLDKVTDRNLRRLLKEHLSTFQINDQSGSAVAFSPEGLEAFSAKWGRRIDSVRTYEDVGNKYPLGGAYVQTEKGTNLFFAIYEDDKGIKKFETIPLMVALQRKMQGLEPTPPKDGFTIVQTISPNDTVYVPDLEEDVSSLDFSNIQSLKGGFYKFVSSSGYVAYFLPVSVSDVILKGKEFESMNKSEWPTNAHLMTEEQKSMIKKGFVKVAVNRLGEVRKLG